MTQLPAGTVFISYSHKDAAYLERLQEHLQPYVRAGTILSWADSHIKPGDDWYEKIQAALAEARVAVLLVSVSYLSSRFVDEVELPGLLAAAQERGLRVLPVILTPCSFAPTPLGRFQAVNDPAEPLSGLSRHKQDLTWERVVEHILGALGVQRPTRPHPHDDDSTFSVEQPSGTAQAAPSPEGVWNVPFRRNPHFTGRDDILSRLDQQLSPELPGAPTTTYRAALTQPQAVKGLGGIGKTQIAVEYAYRSRDLGRYAHTMWINAASAETLLASFADLAALLPGFQARGEKDQQRLVAAIKRWLEQCQQRWLLIFDNADDVSLIQDAVPQGGHGSILLTTRASAVGALAASQAKVFGARS